MEKIRNKDSLKMVDFQIKHLDSRGCFYGGGC